MPYCSTDSYISSLNQPFLRTEGEGGKRDGQAHSSRLNLLLVFLRLVRQGLRGSSSGSSSCLVSTLFLEEELEGDVLG